MSIENRIESLIKNLQNKNASDVIVSLNKTTTNIIRYANNEIMIPIMNDDSILSICVGYNKRKLITELNNLYFDPAQLSNELIKIASQLEEQEVYASLPNIKFQYDDILEPDEETAKISEKSLDFVENIINETLNLNAKKCAGTLKVTYSEIKCWTSNGIYAEDKRTGVMLNHRCFMDSNSTGQWAYSARSIKDLDWKTVVEKAVYYSKLNVNHKKIEPGKYTAILSPMIFASIAEHVANASSAHSVELGYSFLAGKIGTKVASDIFNLIDDPKEKSSAGYARFDQECIPTRRKEIISQGVLKTYLHNLTTAKKFNTESTGNAGINFPLPWSVHVKEGDFKEDEMIKEMRRGLLIVNNWYTRFQNYQTGDFSTILRDGVFLIENSEIKQAFLGARLSDNFLNVLRNIKALSNRVYPIQWWEVNVPTYVPYALVEAVNITTSE